MKSKKEFEEALQDIKREVISNMQQLRDLKKMFEYELKRKRRSRLISGNLNNSSASPARGARSRARKHKKD